MIDENVKEMSLNSTQVKVVENASVDENVKEVPFNWKLVKVLVALPDENTGAVKVDASGCCCC